MIQYVLLVTYFLYSSMYRIPGELWAEVFDTVQEAGIKTVPKGKKWQKGKMAV